MKRIALVTMAAVTGMVFQCCGWGGWAEGFLKKGFIDNRYVDIVTDWLWEDLLIG
jgi:hypothetical protein